MRNVYLTYLLLLFAQIAGCQNSVQQQNHKTTSKSKNMKSESEWKAKLNPEQYRILREKGTEPPFSGKYYLHSEKGIYTCAGCGTELFTSEMKFDAHCGWPSFDKEIGTGDRIKKVKDLSHGMVRTEILCAECGGHLGHVFDDGPTETGIRYCVNSLSLDFIKEHKK